MQCALCAVRRACIYALLPFKCISSERAYVQWREPNGININFNCLHFVVSLYFGSDSTHTRETDAHRPYLHSPYGVWLMVWTAECRLRRRTDGYYYVFTVHFIGDENLVFRIAIRAYKWCAVYPLCSCKHSSIAI